MFTRGKALVALRRLKLSQFSQMSFTTKILMFLDPDSYPVLDLRIAKAYANRPDFPPLQGLRDPAEYPHHGPQPDLLCRIRFLDSENRRKDQRNLRVSSSRPESRRY